MHVTSPAFKSKAARALADKGLQKALSRSGPAAHAKRARAVKALPEFERLRETGQATVTYVELPGAQHAFDLVPSIRSTYVVQAIDRYLHWHWNRWRRARAGDVA